MIYNIFLDQQLKREFKKLKTHIFYNLFIVLQHEFYHHICTKGGIHRVQRNILICSQKTLLTQINRPTKKTKS